MSSGEFDIDNVAYGCAAVRLKVEIGVDMRLREQTLRPPARSC